MILLEPQTEEALTTVAMLFLAYARKMEGKEPQYLAQAVIKWNGQTASVVVTYSPEANYYLLSILQVDLEKQTMSSPPMEVRQALADAFFSKWEVHTSEDPSAKAFYYIGHEPAGVVKAEW